MGVSHTCSGKCSLLTSFLLKERNRSNKRSANEVVTPVAKKIRMWAMDRLDQLKTQEGGCPPDVPREWIQLMNHQCFKGQPMAVRGAAVRYPSTWDADAFFNACVSGVDLLTYIPMTRWDHSGKYNPDPEGWKFMQTWTQHVACMEGAELFDNKQFAITPAESKVMDPQQRVVLECGYEALYNGGLRRGQIMNSLGGMYLGYGSANSDYGYVERSADSASEGSFGATGGSAAITANRFSFCLGMKGASIAIDAEDASALVATHQGCEALQYKGHNVRTSFSCVGGLKINMAVYFWSQKQAMGLMSHTGRCMSFDAGADGYALGDSCVNMCVKTMVDIIDGQAVIKESDYLVGLIVASTINSNGNNAKMSAPNGTAQQEMISMAIHNAGLSGFDVNAVEAYGCADVLADAVEISSWTRVCRSAEESSDPLPITCVKSTGGNMSYGCGTAGLLRALQSNRAGSMSPSQHLNQLNPHIDGFSDQPLLFLQECAEFHLGSAYYATGARGLGGTNAFALGWGRVDDKTIPPAPMKKEEDRLVFWPGGGGRLESGATPKKGFHIAGTFTQWEAEPMELESPGTYGFTMTLGDNRWEQFQIWLDGDAKKSLYPAELKAPKRTAVKGPDASTGGNTWHIDGRTSWMFQGDGGAALEDGATPDASEGALATKSDEWVQVGGVDRGVIGAQYRIRLYVAGKYRMVDWERLSGATEETDLAAMKDNFASLPASVYHVSGEWNGWGIAAMTEVPSDDPTTSSFTAEVQLLRGGGEFQLMRNTDVHQILYPSSEFAGCEEPADVNGPDDESEGCTWYLDGHAGDCFKIEFTRSRAECLDVKTVSWKRTETKALTDEQHETANRPRYAVFGTWNGGTRLRELEWTGTHYRVYIELGPDVKESFQIVEELDWDRIWHPDKADASGNASYNIIGPSPSDGRSRGLNWTIGKEGFEVAGEVYEVKVQIEGQGPYRRVSAVTWQRNPRGFDLAPAEAVGLVMRRRR